MNPADRAMREYYAARAPIYDEVYLRPERQADLDHLRRWVPAQFVGRAVLEVACGTGYWTQFIAPVAARVVAVDAVAEPLAFARLRPGAGRVEFVQADAFALPESLGTFDAAFAGLWFSHVPVERRRGFLAGLHARLSGRPSRWRSKDSPLGRSAARQAQLLALAPAQPAAPASATVERPGGLKPGARVVLVDNTDAQCARLPIAERDRAGNGFQLRTLPDGSTHRVLKNFPSEAELRSLADGV